MEITYLVVTCAAVLANAGIAAADFAKAPFVLANSQAVGVPAAWIPSLGLLKAAGAAGLLLGLLGLRPLGIAAGIGLVPPLRRRPGLPRAGTRPAHRRGPGPVPGPRGSGPVAGRAALEALSLAVLR
ncbi:DoxX family protein [Streptomyces sp. NPDC020800]|uniref:DoxX family protein n=1 Tax=Streptomyces sp. NPDC020800 TaxID=3365092 RepID=UPI00378FAC06